MDSTDILLTLYSIIAGLGIERLVQGLASLIEQRRHVRLYWVHSAWLFLTMTAHVVTIFALIRFTSSPHWTVFNAMLTLSMPLLLYLISDLMVPTIGESGSVDLRSYFYATRRWFYSLMIALALCGMAVQVAIEREIDMSRAGLLRVLAVLALAVGLASRRPAVQSTVIVVLLALVASGATLISVELM